MPGTPISPLNPLRQIDADALRQMAREIEGQRTILPSGVPFVRSESGGTTFTPAATVSIGDGTTTTAGIDTLVFTGSVTVSVGNDSPGSATVHVGGSGSSSTFTFQEFTVAGVSSFTVTGSMRGLYVECIGGGGGGGSGRASAGITGGGGGGAGGQFTAKFFSVTGLGGTGFGVIYLSVGAGGTGGPEATPTANGNDGAAGGDSSFGTGSSPLLLVAYGGQPGAGGSASVGGDGGAINFWGDAHAAAAYQAPGGDGDPGTSTIGMAGNGVVCNFGPGGGGGGGAGGINYSLGLGHPGGTGGLGFPLQTGLVPGGQYTSGGGPPTVTSAGCGGYGSSGIFGSTGPSAGRDGVSPGGGGGGGGGSGTGNSCKGGDGATGRIRVWAW